MSDTVTIKMIAGEIIINNSIPPNNNCESDKHNMMVLNTQTKDTRTSLRFLVKMYIMIRHRIQLIIERYINS